MEFRDNWAGMAARLAADYIAFTSAPRNIAILLK